MRFLMLAFLVLSLNVVFRAEAATAKSGSKKTVKKEISPTPTPTEAWKKELIAGLQLNQAAFNYWQQGGSSFISWQAALRLKLERDEKALNWLNTAYLSYGMTDVQGQGNRKSADEINLESILSWKTWPQVSPFIAFSFLSQFDAGFDYTKDPAPQISAFLDPGYFIESAGLKYEPSPIFNTRVGFAVKETVARQFAGLYTDDPSTLALDEIRVEGGLISVSELKLKLSEQSSFSSKLDMFWNGKALDQTVVDWRNLLTASLNKVISLNAEFDLRYDDPVFKGWQIKETLGVAFAFSLL